MELSLQNLSVAISGNEILKSISLTVREGEFVSLLGASGCGKSTLLKAIAGIIPQSEGSVIIGGKSADMLPTHRRGTVIVFQDFRLFPHMSAAENIGFPLKMRGAARSEYAKTALELLEKVQLKGFENRMPHEMSGGQIQRVALARALAASPNVLLLDEPFSSLDVNLRQDMRSLVIRLQREFEITTVLVTHDRHEALTMSDRIALMADGSILQYDTPEKIFQSPASRQVAEYLGDASYLEGFVKDGIFKSGIVEFPSDKPNGLYQAMLRPSMVRIAPKGDKSFRIAELSYQGESYSALLEHLETGAKIRTLIQSPCPYRLEDKVALSIDTDKAILFPANK